MKDDVPVWYVEHHLNELVVRMERMPDEAFTSFKTIVGVKIHRHWWGGRYYDPIFERMRGLRLSHNFLITRSGSISEHRYLENAAGNPFADRGHYLIRGWIVTDLQDLPRGRKEELLSSIRTRKSA